MYLRTAARDALKAQAKSLNMTVLDYMDLLAKTHEEGDDNLYQVQTANGSYLYLKPDILLGMVNGDLKENDAALYEVLLQGSDPVKS